MWILKKYTISKNDATSSFKSAVYSKRYESIAVVFLPFPSGTQVINVQYTNGDHGMTPQKFNHLTKDKYGRPNGPKILSYLEQWADNGFWDDLPKKDSQHLTSVALKNKFNLTLQASQLSIFEQNEALATSIEPSKTTF